MTAPQSTEKDLTEAHDAIIRAAAAAPVEDDCNPLLTMLNAMLREARAQAWDEGHRGLCRRHGAASFAACRNPYRVIPPVQRCQTCIHPEGYDRLSGPCPTCGGDGVIPSAGETR